MTDTIISFMLDSVSYYSKPTEFGTIRNRIQQPDKLETNTLEYLAGAIENGRAFMPCTIKNGAFVSQQLFCIDVDNTTDHKTPLSNPLQPEELWPALEPYGLKPSITYFTFRSNAPTWPRFRVIFLAEQDVLSAATAEDYRKRLISLFNRIRPGCADTGTADQARIFLGSTHGSVFQICFNPIPLSTFDALPAAAAAEPEPKQQPRKAAAKPRPTAHDQLREDIQSFDLLSYILETVPGVSTNGSFINPCPICGHTDDFTVTGNLWHCFGSSGNNAGGTIIDFLMIHDHMTKREAIETFKYDILGYSRPQQGRPASEKPMFGLAALEQFFEANNIKLQLNAISQEYIISGFPGENQDHLPENLAALIHDQLMNFYRGVTLNMIKSKCNVIASRNEMNPILEKLNSVKLDTSKDLIEEVFDILGLEPTDSMSRCLVRKWMLQTYGLLLNNMDNPYGAEGVLVLCGPQGCGKTSFFRKLAIERKFFMEGLSFDIRNKDDCIKATSKWICELGELDATFKKSDIAAIKSFVTDQTDVIRKPYADTFSKTPRRTSFCATVNSDKFLIDETGNRRWWVIHVDKIDLDRLDKLDVSQLWKQIADMYGRNNVNGDTRCFRLTPEELGLLNEQNHSYEKPIAGMLECEEILSQPEPVEWKDVSLTDFKEFYSDVLRNYSVEQIGRALTKLGVNSQIVYEGKTSRRVRKLPFKKYFNN